MTEQSRGRIALLNSPYVLNEPFFQQMPPLSILYLAAYYEKTGFEPKIFNLNFKAKDEGIYYFGFDLSSIVNCVENMIISEEETKLGLSIDIRMTIEKIKNYKEIIRWKKKIQFYNMLYSWKDILFNSGFLNLNTFLRLVKGVFMPKKVGQKEIVRIIDKFMPLPIMDRVSDR